MARSVGGDQFRVFLVTNKHVIHRDSALRGSVSEITAHFNTKEADGSRGMVSGKVLLSNADRTPRTHEHPDPDTDVFVLEVTDIMALNPRLDKRWATYDDFADEAKRKDLETAEISERSRL